MASSYIQAIVNEVYIRARGSTVLFDAEARKFAYGSSAIVMSTKTRKDPVDKANGSAVSFSFKPKGGVADLLSDDVGEDVKLAVRKQEENLDGVERVHFIQFPF